MLAEEWIARNFDSKATILLDAIRVFGDQNCCSLIRVAHLRMRSDLRVFK